MALNQWFKFYGGEYLSDPKIASLSAQERSCWVTILALASISSTSGTIEYLTIEVLLEKSGIHFDPYHTDEWNQCLSVLDKFVRMKMLTKTEDGALVVKNWSKRQETALTNAERQARYRERNVKVTKPVTKVTLDKIRVEENKEDFAEPKSLPLREVSEDSTKLERKPSNKEALSLREWCYDQIEKETEVRPTTNMGDYVQLTKALKTLKVSDIKTMMQDALEAGKAQTVRGVFTDRQIDIYRQENL